MPLAPGMKDKLARRDEIDLNDRKANDYNVRRYIKKHLKDIDDILWALDRLPGGSLKRMFTGEDVMRLQKLEEKIIELMDITPVIDENLVHNFNVKADIRTEKETSKDWNIHMQVTMPAKPEEIELSAHIHSHSLILNHMLSPVLPKDPEVYSLKDFNSKVLRDIAEIATERGQAYQVKPSAVSAVKFIKSEEDPK